MRNSKIKGTFKFYTGFSYEDFMNIFIFLVPEEHELPFTIPKNTKAVNDLAPKDQFFMVLTKLRLNYGFKHLAHMFKISPNACGILSDKLQRTVDCCNS